MHGWNPVKPDQQAETGFDEWHLWARAVKEDDIDPADFFDLEKFGYRRRGKHAPRP